MKMYAHSCDLPFNYNCTFDQKAIRKFAGKKKKAKMASSNGKKLFGRFFKKMDYFHAIFVLNSSEGDVTYHFE
jgi:hypothetical protein